LDDLEYLLYLIEFLHKGALPWKWPTIPEDTNCEDLKERKESWFLEEPPLRAFLPSIPHDVYFSTMHSQSARITCQTTDTFKVYY
jgi:hypothetical protein